MSSFVYSLPKNSKSICVFCASSIPKNPAYAIAASGLGNELALRDHTLVYGGSHRGLMGLLADAVLDAPVPSKVIGVLPESMRAHEYQHPRLTQLHLTKSMHERKAKMEKLSDAFLVLPGGLGTMEEFFELYTWLNLNIHSKPIGIINVDGFFDGIIQWLKRAVQDGVVSEAMQKNLIISADIQDGINQIEMKMQQGKQAIQGQILLTWHDTLTET